MAALDTGAGCEGLLFRIAQEDVERESEVLWRREQVGPAYTPTFVDALVCGESLKALTFVADHDADLIDDSLTREQQIQYVATGTGFMGSSLDYLKGIDQKFTALGIHDAEVTGLLRDVEKYALSCPGSAFARQDDVIS